MNSLSLFFYVFGTHTALFSCRSYIYIYALYGICIYIHTYTHTHSYTCRSYIHIYIIWYVCVYIYTHTHTHTYKHHTHTRTHTYSHTHAARSPTFRTPLCPTGVWYSSRGTKCCVIDRWQVFVLYHSRRAEESFVGGPWELSWILG